MKYNVTIEFTEEKHCLRCPLRNSHSDDCNLQTRADELGTWEEQMENCPLKEVSDVSTITN